MGDFLITNSVQPNVTPFDVVSKKVEIFGKNLAVGWTGAKVVASAVLQDMREKAALGVVIDKKWLEECLTSYGAEDFGTLDIHLVGWLISDEDYCFRWNSSYPEQLFYGDPMIDGSGQDAFSAIFGKYLASEVKPEDIPFDTSAVTSFDMASSTSIGIALELMSDENLSNFFRSLGVGHAYEIIYLGDDGFQYIDNLLYFTLTAHFGLDGLAKSARLESIYYKYFTYHQHSVILKVEHEKNNVHISIASPPGFTATSDFVISLGNKLVGDVMSNEYCRSNYYCCYIKAVAPDFVGGIFPFVLPSNAHENFPVKVDIPSPPLTFGISFPLSELTFIYQNFRLNQDNTGPQKWVKPPDLDF